MIKASMWTQTNLREEAMILKLSELVLGKMKKCHPQTITESEFILYRRKRGSEAISS